MLKGKIRTIACHVGVLGVLTTFCMTDTGRAQTISLMPVSSTTSYVVAGDEIYITPGGAVVDLEAIITDWSLLSGNPDLAAARATIHPSGYLGANATPPNPGVDLLPLGFALPNPNGGNRPLGYFVVTDVCSIGGRDCSPGQPSCTLGEGSCMTNPRWVVAVCAPQAFFQISTMSLGYESWANCDTLTGVVDPHDPNRGYISSLRLQIPPAAIGRYEVGLDNSAFTIVQDTLGNLHFERKLQSAKINIVNTLPTDPGPNVPKNRYVTFAPSAVGPVAYRIELISNSLNPSAVGFVGWVGAPATTSTLGDVSLVVDAPVFRNWDEFAVHIGDCEIMPGCTYELRATDDGTTFQFPEVLATAAEPADKDWCDVVGAFSGSAWPPPDGFANVNDIVGVLATVTGKPNAPSAVRANLRFVSTADPCLNPQVNVGDVFMVVLAVNGQAYPFTTDPATCPPCP